MLSYIKTRWRPLLRYTRLKNVSVSVRLLVSIDPSVYFSVFYILSLTANDSNFTAKVCLPSIGMAFSVNHMFMHD